MRTPPFDLDEKTLKKFDIHPEAVQIAFGDDGRLLYRTPYLTNPVVDAVWCGLIQVVDPLRCTYRVDVLDERHTAIMGSVRFLAEKMYADRLREWRPSGDILLRDIEKPLWENEHLEQLLDETCAKAAAVRYAFGKDGRLAAERPKNPYVAVAWGALRTTEVDFADQRASSEAYVERVTAFAEGRPIPQRHKSYSMPSSEVREIRALVLGEDGDQLPRYTKWQMAALYDAVRYMATRYLMEKNTFVPSPPADAVAARKSDASRMEFEARIERVDPNPIDEYYEPWAVTMSVRRADSAFWNSAICFVDDDLADEMRGHEGETVTLTARYGDRSNGHRSASLVDADVEFSPAPGMRP